MPDDITRKSVDPSVRQSLVETAMLQKANHLAYEREPLVKDIPDQGFVLATVAGTSYIYTRIGTQRYKVALTAV